MNRNKLVTIITIALLVTGNVFMTYKYFEEKKKIQWNPLLPDYTYALMETDYMKNILWYIVGFNAILIIAFLIVIFFFNKGQYKESQIIDQPD